jgi:hypothetical protein
MVPGRARESEPQFRLGIFPLMSSLLRSLGHDCRIFAHRHKKCQPLDAIEPFYTQFATCDAQAMHALKSPSELFAWGVRA